ncbi:cell division protein SepF [Spiroplasma culicicola]|uniref:Cell division protein SepF n=1 Tax=Spiroplasma culicicola AES-1 TaxID=1276246 RepID=W6AHF1_9MOLU|nr:cell division protein SepF [Spiroplasma culicicola]AHI53124.1 hypothetical protein SCULI_v1c07830 [Spiroplasma culicicola AES-1]
MALFNKKNKNVESEQVYQIRDEQSDVATADQVVFDTNHVTHFLPLDNSETNKIADCLLKFRHVTINLSRIDKSEKRRLIDFLLGVMYALNGDYKKIDTNVYYFWISE